MIGAWVALLLAFGVVFFSGVKAGARSMMKQAFGPGWTPEERDCLDLWALEIINGQGTHRWDTGPESITPYRWRQCVGRRMFYETVTFNKQEEPDA